MVLQIGPNAHAVAPHINARRAKNGSRPDPGELQQLRRVDRSTAQDDVSCSRYSFPLSPAQERNSGCPASIEQDFARLRACDHREVRALHGRMQVGNRGGLPQAAADGHLHQAGAILFPAVIVGCFRNPRLFAGLQKRGGDRVLKRCLLRGEIAVFSTQVRAALLPPLRATEIGQHIGPCPALAPHLPPGIEIARLAAHIDQPVDGG